MLTGEAAVVACALFTNIAFLWYNVIGAVVVVFAGIFLASFQAPDTGGVAQTAVGS